MIKKATVKMPERIVILVATTPRIARPLIVKKIIEKYGAFVNFSRRRKNDGRTWS